MLSRQCGKATAVFVRSTHRDMVAQVSECRSRGLDLIFPVLYPINFYCCTRTYEYESWYIFLFFRVRAARNKHVVPYMIRDVVFDVFSGTLLRPTAGAVVLIRKSTTLQNVPWLCASIQEESCAISLWPSTATSAVNIG